MELNDVGSYTSIIALLAMAIGGFRALIKKYKNYKGKRQTEADDFKRFVTSIIDDSTTPTERADAAALVQHTLSIYNSKISKGYFQIIIYLICGMSGYVVFQDYGIVISAWAALALGVGLSLTEYWLVTVYAKDVSISEWEIGRSWALHLDRARDRKERKK